MRRRGGFTALTDDQDTAFLGQIDSVTGSRCWLLPPLMAARKALDLKPQSALAATQLLQLHVTSKIGQQRQTSSPSLSKTGKSKLYLPELLRQHIVLYYLDGLAALETEQDTACHCQFLAALRNDPAFCQPFCAC